MQLQRWQNRAPRAVFISAAFALGAITMNGLRGNTAQQSNVPPVQPPAQALSMQSAFEQVADKLRPSVVYIRSRQAITRPRSSFRQGADEGDDATPFQFPGFPNIPGFGGQGGRQFQVAPPMYQPHAEASGSGVIVRSDGYILTNDHVVEGADKVMVRLQDGREFTGKVMRDFKSDLAIVKIDATDLPAAELADSDKIKIGQWAIAFGSPFGLSDTMTVGVVSSLHREQAIGEGSDGRFYSSLVQTDASINPGNSGGPLVDVYGRVVGIDVAIESPSGTNAGIGFAIPSNTASYIVNQLITKGSVTRGYLGLAPTTPTYSEKQQYGVKQGVLVSEVNDNTPASRAGFQVEDVILKFDGKSVEDDGAFRDMVARTAPGTTVPVVIKRDGSERTLNVTVGTPPTQPTQASYQEPEHPSAKGKLGVQIANIGDPQLPKELAPKSDLKSGAVVVEVMPGSPAAEAGIQQGDVILRLNGQIIHDANQLSEAASNLKDGSTVSAVIRRGAETVLAQISLE